MQPNCAYIHSRVIRARTRAHIEKIAAFSLKLGLCVNRRFLVNEHGDVLSMFLSSSESSNAFFLCSEYINKSFLYFANSSKDKFVASRSLHFWNKLNSCNVFVLKHTVMCFLKSMQYLIYCLISRFSSSLFFLLLGAKCVLNG